MATWPAGSQLLNLHRNIREGVFFLGWELVPKFLRAAAEFPSPWESLNKNLGPTPSWFLEAKMAVVFFPESPFGTRRTRTARYACASHKWPHFRPAGPKWRPKQIPSFGSAPVLWAGLKLLAN